MYYFYVCRVKTMSFESTRENRLTFIPINIYVCAYIMYYLLGSRVAKTDVSLLEGYHCVLTGCIHDEFDAPDAYAFIYETIAVQAVMDCFCF